MAYQNLIYFIPFELVDELSERLTQIGALAISLEDAENESIFQIAPEETPLWKKVKLIALFPDTENLPQVVKTLQQQIGMDLPLTYQIEPLEEQDWVRLTQKNFPAQCYGNHLWICPEWENSKAYSGYVVRIDPGLAFGTGTHPTTALCLQWLAKHPPKQKTVIDYGCGSGILALAAMALGAKTVWAIDHDPQAIEATAQNAQMNTFATRDKFHIGLPQQLPKIQADLIIANILAKPLIELAPHLKQLVTTNGLLVLSGILSDEMEQVATAYQTEMHIVNHATQEEWAMMVLSR